jgi:hypothetical protein
MRTPAKTRMAVGSASLFHCACTPARQRLFLHSRPLSSPLSSPFSSLFSSPRPLRYTGYDDLGQLSRQELNDIGC